MRRVHQTAVCTLVMASVTGGRADLPQSQKQLLADIYYATGGDSWNGPGFCSGWGDWVKSNFTNTTLGPCSGAEDYLPLVEIHLNETNRSKFGGIGFAGCIVCNPANDSVLAINMGANSATGPIPKALCNLTELQNFEAHGNLFSGELPSCLCNLTNLKTLELSSNDLTGAIPPCLGRLLGLKSLILHLNALTGPIPQSLSALANLTQLSLYSNKLTGGAPHWLRQLTNLQSLWLGHNPLGGEIPDLSQLDQLTSLYISHSNLTGEFPPWLSQLPMLKIIDVSNNSLTGTIPATVCDLTQLVSFEAHTNNISGILPACFGENQPNLIQVKLGMNRLHGALPRHLLKSATIVILEKNHLSSFNSSDVHPPGPGLQQLAIGHNNFSGEIPSMIFTAGILDLDLSYNHFSGTLPPEICYANNLEFFKVQGNRLSGQLPDCLYRPDTLTNLSTLMMSCQVPLLAYQSCPRPFSIPESGDRSMLALLQAMPSIARIDVAPETLENMVGTRTTPASLWPDYSSPLQVVSQALWITCLLLSVLVLGIAYAAGHFWPNRFHGLADLDRWPQYGFVDDHVEGSLHTHDFRGSTHGAATDLGGVFNVCKNGVLIFFVGYSVAAYCLRGLQLETTTTPDLAFLPKNSVNFTLTFTEADGQTPLPIQHVNDPWFVQELRYRGHLQKHVDKLLKPHGSSYSFPIGWDVADNSRTVTVKLNASQIARAGGFTWSLNGGTKQHGQAPNPQIRVDRPGLSGDVITVPVSSSTCVVYNSEAVPDLQFGQWCYYSTVHTGGTACVNRLGGFQINGSNSSFLVGPCLHLGEDAELVVPGRKAPEALFGPTQLLCLSELELYVQAVPRDQTTPEDWLGGTSTYQRQSYVLGLDGAKPKMNFSYALPGLWQNTSFPPRVGGSQCPHCTVRTECPDAKVTVVLIRSTFGISEKLVRSVAWVQYGPQVLASCFSLAAVFLFFYEKVGNTALTLKHYGHWASIARERATGESIEGEAETARAELDTTEAQPGWFVVFKGEEDPDPDFGQDSYVGTAVLCILIRHHVMRYAISDRTHSRTYSRSEKRSSPLNIQEPTKHDLHERLVDLPDELRLREIHLHVDSKGRVLLRNPSSSSSRQPQAYKSLLEAIRQLATGKVPGESDIILTTYAPDVPKARRMTVAPQLHTRLACRDSASATFTTRNPTFGLTVEDYSA